MYSLFVRKMQPAAVAAAIACLAVSGLMAQGVDITLPNVTYTATGTFTNPQVSGSDLYQLRGQPFTINAVGNEATKPTQHGKGWGLFTGLKMKGKVSSGLLSTPVTIESAHTLLALAIGNPSYDVFNMIAPVIVFKQRVTITAKLQLPPGTMTKWLIYPFAMPAQVNASSGTVTYAQGSSSTTLTIANGTVNAVKGAKAATVAMVGAEKPGQTTVGSVVNKFAVLPKNAMAQLALA